jgi:quercetin dioxygenase-like cupin family protein
MNFSYPHTIDNGFGETLTFVRHVNDENGGRIEVTNRVSPGAGPPMHVHFLQDESLTVLEGKIGTQIAGQAPLFYGPGETVVFRRGEVHRFWNAGQEMLICEGWIGPAYNIEFFLTEIFLSIKANGGKAPKPFDAAFLLSKYKSEFDMIEVPRFVKKVIFPIIVLIGKLTGKYRKFAGAPAPVVNR